MSGYIGPAPVPQATQTREAFTATSGQTTFNTGGYTAGFIDVYLNGVKLAAADYTATNGSDVVLAVGAAADDILETVAYSAFTVADQDFTGETTAEDLTVTGAFTSQGIDDNATSTAMTLDSNGNLLVGSTNTDGFDGTSGLKVASNTAGFLLERTGTRGWLQYIDSSGGWRLYDSTDNQERVIVDSSGNLLVGKTSADGTTTEGSEIRDGRAYFSAASGSILHVNRNTTDGEIIDIRKDGTTVGSIGTTTNSYLWAGGTNSGIFFYNNGFGPSVGSSGNGALTDGTKDIGASGNRFRDAYLSGGVYLGGVGSSNRLDDYEEGTWTPTLSGASTTGSYVYTSQTGSYTKIGNKVHFVCSLSISSVTTAAAGTWRISGLPYSADTGAENGNRFLMSLYGVNFDSVNYHWIQGYLSGASYIQFLGTRDGSTWQTMDPAKFAVGVSDIITVNGTYTAL
jgi:hypothetical protein